MLKRRLEKTNDLFGQTLLPKFSIVSLHKKKL